MRKKKYFANLPALNYPVKSSQEPAVCRGHTASGVGWSSRLHPGKEEVKSLQDHVSASSRAISARK